MTTRTRKMAKELRPGDRWAPCDGPSFIVVRVHKKLTSAGMLRVTYLQPQVPGGRAEQRVWPADMVTVEVEVAS